MAHVHGVRVQRLSARTRGVPLDELVAVSVDVGKSTAAAMACDFTGQVLVAPFEFAMSRAGVAELAGRVDARLPAATRLVRVGVEAAGHYHRPLLGAGVLPADWQVVELNPAWVTAQRRVNGSRGVKTDRVDLAAICDLLLAGRGHEVGIPVDALVELTAWVAHRRRRVLVRSGLKNQLTGQVDRCFPGVGACLSSLLDTKVGRLVVTEFADPTRLARLGVSRFRAFAARRDVRVSVAVAQRLVDAARQALPTAEAAVARDVLAADLALLADLDTQIATADARITAILPATRYQVLTTVPGWGPLRAGGYGAAVGDPTGGHQPGRSTARPGSRHRNMSRRGNAATVGSAARVPSSCAGRCLTSVSDCGTANPAHARTRPACGSAASPEGSSRPRSPASPGGWPMPWSATRPHTTRPNDGADRWPVHNRGRIWQADGQEGRIRRRTGYDAPSEVTVVSSLTPGLPPIS